MLALAIVCVVLGQAMRSYGQSLAADPLPPGGTGREIIAIACTQCHGASAFNQLRQGSDAWRLQVYDMILRGAQVRPLEVEPVVEYLAANFGPGINLPRPLQVSLPDGPGRDLVETRCAPCHGLDRVTATRRASAEWGAIVQRMNQLGLPLSRADAKTITAYLSAKIGTNRKGQ